MPAHQWNATVVDSPDSDPFTVVGDLMLVVRTPRSRDFVTVEAGAASWSPHGPDRPGGVVMSPEPLPRMTEQWRGEVRVGARHAVDFQVAGRSYHLTLVRLSENAEGFPWVTCQFRVERD